VKVHPRPQASAMYWMTAVPTALMEQREVQRGRCSSWALRIEINKESA
jgi:hypothetical protein